MNEYLSKKTSGFYLTAAATILSVIGLIFYRSAMARVQDVFTLVMIAAVIEIIMVIVTAVIGNKKILELSSSVCALVVAGALIQSFIPQVDNLGYLVSGLYSFSDMKSFILYAVLTIAALICYIIASFMDQSK